MSQGSIRWFQPGLRAWGPVAAYALAVTALSHQAAISPPAAAPDWLSHAAEFAALGWLVARALRLARGRLGMAEVAVGAAGCILFAGLDEWHQSFVPGRMSSPGDVAADAAGALLALGIEAVRARLGRRGQVEVVLLGRPGCHLCDEAEEVIRSVLRQTGGRLTKRNIEDDAGLLREFGSEIPVVLIDGRKRFKGRVDPERFRRSIASRTARGIGR